jgi:hypothetical protein
LTEKPSKIEWVWKPVQIFVPCNIDQSLFWFLRMTDIEMLFLFCVVIIRRISAASYRQMCTSFH